MTDETTDAIPQGTRVDGVRKFSESERPTVQFKLRLSAEAISRIKARAKSADLDNSQFIEMLFDGRNVDAQLAQPPIERTEKQQLLLWGTRLANALYEHVHSLRGVRNEISGKFGLLKHLFDTSPDKSKQHYDEMRDATFAAKATIEKADEAIETSQNVICELQEELKEFALRLRLLP